MDANTKTELEGMFKAFAESLLPQIDAAAKAAVGAINPIAGIVAAPLIDEIDSYISSLLGNGALPVTAPTDPASQIKQLQQHVAALTVTTGHGTSAAMPINKAAAVVTPAPTAAEPADAT
jgi:hypothetical protein